MISIIGEIQPGHGNLTKREIVDGLCTTSLLLRKHDWRLFEQGKCYQARFPSSVGLDETIGCTLIPHRNHNVGFRVVRCGSEEGVRPHKFIVKAWLPVKGILLHHGSMNDLSKILVKHAQVIDVSEQTSEESTYWQQGCTLDVIISIPSPRKSQWSLVRSVTTLQPKSKLTSQSRWKSR